MDLPATGRRLGLGRARRPGRRRLLRRPQGRVRASTTSGTEERRSCGGLTGGLGRRISRRRRRRHRDGGCDRLGPDPLAEADQEVYYELMANAVVIASHLMSKGYKLVTDGTENHLVLWNLLLFGCTPAMTLRGLIEKDFVQIAEYLHQEVAICLDVQKQRYMDFIVDLEKNKDIKQLRAEESSPNGSVSLHHQDLIASRSLFWLSNPSLLFWSCTHQKLNILDDKGQGISVQLLGIQHADSFGTVKFHDTGKISPLSD
ncbi:hypothetical protein QYE76_064041 [Lolium multiflorum]|uniref:Glycine hydroxymethyltransferase n=1 Tax=Lolium multiflorum TaxID=4521 RepID=A0AAD8S5Q9_LOLMU|nr:hypothetical protein QYE76_064041 [Lolium multiflorum]